MQKQLEFDEQRGIELGRKELFKYRLRHGSVSSAVAADKYEIFPLVKVVVPTFIHHCLPQGTRREQFQDVRAEAMGEAQSEGLAYMMLDKQFNEAMSCSEKIRMELERNRLGRSNDPEDLLREVDTIIESRAGCEDFQSAKQSERSHFPLSRVPGLLRELENSNRRGSMRNLGDGSKRNRNVPPAASPGGKAVGPCGPGEDPLKFLRKHLRTGGGAPRDLAGMQIPTLEQVRKNSGMGKRRSSDCVSPQLHSTPRSWGRRTGTQFSSGGASSRPEKYLVDGYEQLCNAADNLSTAYAQGCGTMLLERYKQGFKQRRSSVETAASRLASSKSSLRSINERTTQLSRALESGFGHINQWVDNETGKSP